MSERPLPCCMCARVCPSFYAQARILAHSRSTPKLLMTNPNLCKLPRPNLKPLSVTDSKSPEEGAHMALSSYEPHRQYHRPPPHKPADRLSKRNLPRPSRQGLCDRCRHQPIVVVVAVEQQHDIVIIDLRIAEAVRAHVLNGHGERAGSGAQVCELECLRLSRRDVVINHLARMCTGALLLTSS